MSRVIYQPSRKLYVIRNVSGRATRKAVMQADSLKLDIISFKLKEIIPYIRVEDTCQQSYANTTVCALFREALPQILLDQDPRWKLWEAEIYTDRLVLHYVDIENTNTTRKKNTDLSCFIFWKQGFECIISAPPQQDIIPAYYHVCFLPIYDNDGYSLNISYPAGSTTRDGRPLRCDEHYSIRPERG